MATKKTQIITLVCNKGGVGRSTTAINIAWSLANKRCNVLVCDLDAQANTSSSLAKNYQEDVIEDGRHVTNLLKSYGDSATDYLVDTRNPNIKLHLIGRLQTNKAKIAVQLFDYIHSLDSKKLADKISKYENEFKVSWKLTDRVRLYNLGEIAKLKGREHYRGKVGVEVSF